MSIPFSLLSNFNWTKKKIISLKINPKKAFSIYEKTNPSRLNKIKSIIDVRIFSIFWLVNYVYIILKERELSSIRSLFIHVNMSKQNFFFSYLNTHKYLGIIHLGIPSILLSRRTIVLSWVQMSKRKKLIIFINVYVHR